MDESAPQALSTSALAKRLKLPIQQLFVTLRDYGWIDRRGKSWALTAKGELHGGGYRDSQRYGRYIVWPESLLEHPLITAIESNQRITPNGMRRYYGHLSARQINRTLTELGLQKPTLRGLEVTDLGERFGGRQERDEEHALWVVSWPHEIVDNAVIHRELTRLVGDGVAVHEPEEVQVEAVEAVERPADADTDDPTGDLFAESAESAEGSRDSAATSATAPQRYALDGHGVDSLLQLRVCDWLYEARLAHARNRRLPVLENLTADFYVPQAGLFIECWERDVPTDVLTRRLRVREVCRELELPYQEVAATDIERIDELLTRCLADLGIRC